MLSSLCESVSVPNEGEKEKAQKRLFAAICGPFVLHPFASVKTNESIQCVNKEERATSRESLVIRIDRCGSDDHVQRDIMLRTGGRFHDLLVKSNALVMITSADAYNKRRIHCIMRRTPGLEEFKEAICASSRTLDLTVIALSMAHTLALPIKRHSRNDNHVGSAFGVFNHAVRVVIHGNGDSPLVLGQ